MFDSALRPTAFELHKSDSTSLVNKSYDYYKDGGLRTLSDSIDHRFDRLNTYDFAARPRAGLTSYDARGETATNRYTQIPYNQSLGFNAFENMTSRSNEQWGATTSQSYSYSNDRITNSGWTYDSDGRVTQSSSPDEAATNEYDAAGKLSLTTSFADSKVTRYYAGDGLETKRTAQRWHDSTSSWVNDGLRGTTYLIRSTLLGGQVGSEEHTSELQSH